jgi:hypothetical protein
VTRSVDGFISCITVGDVIRDPKLSGHIIESLSFNKKNVVSVAPFSN